MLVENICQRMRSGGAHQAVSYGGLDAATGRRILQRLIDLRALTPGMLAAFRGCPVAELSLDSNPRATNALLAELGRKVFTASTRPRVYARMFSLPILRVEKRLNKWAVRAVKEARSYHARVFCA